MLRFPYSANVHTGVPRWRPLIPVFLNGPRGRRRVKALLDTGSDDTIIQDWLAPYLGVQLVAGKGNRVVWRGQPYSIQFGRIGLELTDGSAGFRWSDLVAFSPAPIRYTILGIRGCLQFFDATFCGKDLAVDLTINRSFSGTVL